MEQNYILQNAIEEIHFQVQQFLKMKETDAEYEETVNKLKDLQNVIGEELEKIKVSKR